MKWWPRHWEEVRVVSCCFESRMELISKQGLVSSTSTNFGYQFKDSIFGLTRNHTMPKEDRPRKGITTATLIGTYAVD